MGCDCIFPAHCLSVYFAVLNPGGFLCQTKYSCTEGFRFEPLLQIAALNIYDLNFSVASSWSLLIPTYLKFIKTVLLAAQSKRKDNDQEVIVQADEK